MGTFLNRNLWLLAALTLLAVVACTSGVSPAPTNTPPKPTTAAPTPATKSTGSTPQDTKPAAGTADKTSQATDWKAEWEKTLAAAKKEGKVVIGGAREDLYRQAAVTFQKAYPDIQVEYVGSTGADFAPKILAEREGGLYLWDVQIGGGSTPLQMLKPKGVFDPLKSAILLPEVLDDTKWLGGFDDGFLDSEAKFFYQFQGYLTFTAYANRDMVSEAELNSIDQLIDPKWKGKIATQDPRSTGSTGTSMGYLLTLKSEEWLRKLLSQDLVIMKEGRQLAEMAVRGRYPIALGIPDVDLEQFRKEGLGANVKPIAPHTDVGARITGGSGGIALINKAAHPNAAKVFINWLLSQPGQKAFVDFTNVSSRRLDAPGGLAESVPDTGIKYINIQKEKYQPNLKRAGDIAKELIR